MRSGFGTKVSKQARLTKPKRGKVILLKPGRQRASSPAWYECNTRDKKDTAKYSKEKGLISHRWVLSQGGRKHPGDDPENRTSRVISSYTFMDMENLHVWPVSLKHSFSCPLCTEWGESNQTIICKWILSLEPLSQRNTEYWYGQPWLAPLKCSYN